MKGAVLAWVVEADSWGNLEFFSIRKFYFFKVT